MSLADLIRKNSSEQVATATPATVATDNHSLPGTVARVATVAVATPQNEKPATIPLIELQAIAARFDFTVQQLRDAAGADWVDIVDDGAKVTAWAQLLADNDTRAGGHVPSHYTTPGECAQCGPVWLWPGAEKVLACPWCANRDAGLLIPRPKPVICQDCEHYTRDTLNPVGGFGSCAKRQGSYLPFHRSNCFAHQPKETDK